MKKISSLCTYFSFAAMAFLIACSSSPSDRVGFGSEKAPGYYRVKKGDTLFSIAWRFGLDTKTIQQRNNIKNPHRILIGQNLRIKALGTTNKSHSASKKSNNKRTSSHTSHYVVKKAHWSWPIRGKIIRRFSPGRVGGNGIRIAGKPNQTVNAAESGTVVYKGNGLSGYGNVVIIKDRNGLLCAYGFLKKTFVKKGQKISKKQKIGTVGYASNKKHMLHFEVRKNGRPVNPLSYIGSTYRF